MAPRSRLNSVTYRLQYLIIMLAALSDITTLQYKVVFPFTPQFPVSFPITPILFPELTLRSGSL